MALMQSSNSEKAARDRVESTAHQFDNKKPYINSPTIGLILQMRDVGATLKS